MSLIPVIGYIGSDGFGQFCGSRISVKIKIRTNDQFVDIPVQFGFPHIASLSFKDSIPLIFQ
jgi:hypothetical protein